MRTLSDMKIPITIRTGCFACMSTLLSTINNYIKVLNSVILFILYRTNTILSSLMVNQFPFLQTPTQRFCHHKPMFKYITTFRSHRVKEVILSDPNKNVTTTSLLASTLPRTIFIARKLFTSTTTFNTMQPKWFSILKGSPSLLTTCNTSHPDIFIHSRLHTIMPFGMDFFGSLNFTNKRHTLLYHTIKAFASEDRLCVA